MALREELNALEATAAKVSGQRPRHPRLRARPAQASRASTPPCTGDAIRVYHRVHIGMAVAIEDGLITPVLRDAT